MTDHNIAQALYRVAAGREDKVALVTREGGTWREWRFRDLLAGCAGYGLLLQARGVRRGDRVMLMVRPSLAFVCLTFALFRLGAVVILIDPGMGYRNLLRCIGTVRPDFLVSIPAAVLFSHLFRRTFNTIRRRIMVTRRSTATALTLGSDGGPEGVRAGVDDLAAIIFTTGSTGPPKGVQYTHGIFHTQLELIRDYYAIGPDDVDQPGFPLFGLFATALGARAVIPDMDPTRPAQVNPEKFVRTLLDHQVSYSFGSPAIWNVVSRYCLERAIVLPVRTVLMAGAPVSGELVERVQRILPAKALVYTPYGATESLPVTCLEGREIVTETWPLTRSGHGTCVGRPLPGMMVRVIEPVDGPIETWDRVCEMPVGEIGEIVVRGPVVTRVYDGNEHENLLAKIRDKNGFWHHGLPGRDRPVVVLRPQGAPGGHLHRGALQRDLRGDLQRTSAGGPRRPGGTRALGQADPGGDRRADRSGGQRAGTVCGTARAGPGQPADRRDRTIPGPPVLPGGYPPQRQDFS
jgi:acyl-CoA synthetase (AMP-forming)/AMP-acid ligase II